MELRKKCLVCASPTPKLNKYCSQRCAARGGTRRLRGKPIADSEYYYSTDTDFYVYGWLEGNTVFNIGKGRGYRVHDGGRRNNSNSCNVPLCVIHRAAAKLAGTFSFGYFAKNLTEKQAYELERQLIARIRPYCNEEHNPTPFVPSPFKYVVDGHKNIVPGE